MTVIYCESPMKQTVYYVDSINLLKPTGRAMHQPI
jgi:hypothetical protein